MGLVYLANDRRTGLPAAIKVISGWAWDAELEARFLEETRILSALDHRNIGRCHEITQSRDGIPSIVMEYVDGVDFYAFEGRPFPELLPLMIQALTGLAYLRSQNILHRDLSSNNIFVTLENDKRVTKILDLGMATILQQGALDGDVKTQTGRFLGKLAFASPEHFLQSNIDWRTDVYSLGVIFHRLLTGKPPITVARESNYFDWLVAHQKEHRFEVESPADIPPLPKVLRDVVRRMLARSPDDRPQSYEEIIDVLDRIQRDLEPDPRTLRTLPPPVVGKIVSNPGGRPVPVVSERPVSVEESQQKRWPDLERVVDPPAGRLEIPAIETGPASPRASADATSTAAVLESGESERGSEVPTWMGGAAKDPLPVPVRSLAEPVQDKTERLDDVIAKLRQQAVLAPVSAVPPSQPVRRPETAPEPGRTNERAPAAQPAPAGRRLVVYGGPPPPSVKAPPRPVPSVAAPAPDATGRRIRWIGVGLIVAAIVILFAAVLWVLVSLVRGATPRETPRNSRGGSSGAVAGAAHTSVDPKSE